MRQLPLASQPPPLHQKDWAEDCKAATRSGIQAWLELCDWAEAHLPDADAQKVIELANAADAARKETMDSMAGEIRFWRWASAQLYHQHFGEHLDATGRPPQIPAPLPEPGKIVDIRELLRKRK